MEIKKYSTRNKELEKELEKLETDNEALDERLMEMRSKLGSRAGSRLSRPDSQLSKTHSRTDSRLSKSGSRGTRSQIARQIEWLIELVKNIENTMSNGSGKSYRISTTMLENLTTDDTPMAETFSNILRQVKTALDQYTNDFLSTIDTSRNDYDELNIAYNTLNDQASETIKNLTSDIEELTKHLKLLQEEKISLHDEISSVNEGLSAVEAERENLIETNNKLVAVNRELNSRLHETGKDVNEKNQEISRLNKELANFEDLLETKDKEVFELRNLSKTEKTLLEDRTSEEKLKSVNRASAELIRVTSEATLADSEKDYHEIVEMLLKSIHDIISPDVKLENILELLPEIFETVSEFNKMVEQLDTANEINTTAANMIDEKERIILELNEQKETAEAMITELKMQIQDQTALNNQAHDETENQLNHSEKRLSELNDSINTLTTQLYEFESENAKLEESLAKAVTDLKLEQAEHAISKKKINESEGNSQEIEILQNRIETLNQIITKHEEETQVLKKKLNIVEMEKSSTKNELEALKKGFHQTKQLAQELERENKDFKRLERAYNELRRTAPDPEQVEQLNYEVTALKNKLSKFGLSREKLQQRHEQDAKNMNRLIEEYNKLVERNKELESQFHGAQHQRLLRLDDQLRTQRERVAAFEAEVAVLKQKYGQRGLDFFGILSEILEVVEMHCGDEKWNERLSLVLADIRKQPGSSIENYRQLADLAMEGIKQRFEAPNSEVLRKLSTASKSWVYRYCDMKSKFEKEQELRKMEYDSYSNYVKTIEGDLHRYRVQYKNAIETINKLQKV